MISKKSKIFLSGHKGLVGSAILKKLKEQGYKNVITRTREQLDLRNQKKVLNFFKKNNFAAVINAAAKVGGIHANNKYRADFIFDNLSIQNNIVYSSFLTKVKRLIFLGSSCVYPRSCKQPIKEEYLLTGSLEKTNEPYAIAKIAGIKLCENFNKQYKTNYLCLMPCNIYGPNDNYHKSNSHFFPSLIKNLGASLKINYDRSMMDGTPRKILDSSIARKYGWKPKHNLKEGFEKTYNQYINKFKNKKVISVS